MKSMRWRQTNSEMSTLRSSGNALRAVDNRLVRLFGLGYLRLTRDVLIHERLGYLVKSVRNLGRSGLRVLDVGCGSGMALYYLDRFCRGIVGEYVGVDMKIERLRERWRFVNLPYAFQPVNLDDQWDFGTFDVVWCSEVIEHLLDDKRLFRRLGAQLGSSGVLVITTPSLPFMNEWEG
jgi:2-polyprenyl-3-methyl-5-hydroxy-6-metoxy-1,4-benzoquinol methylase